VTCGFFINSERSRASTALLGAVEATPEAEDISLGSGSLLSTLDIFDAKGKDSAGFSLSLSESSPLVAARLSRKFPEPTPGASMKFPPSLQVLYGTDSESLRTSNKATWR
jgi:hypothetical protein